MFDARLFDWLAAGLAVLCFVALPASATAGGGANCGFGSFEGEDNTIRLFPTYAVLSPKGDTVLVPIHVWIYEREQDVLRRHAIDEIGEQLDIDKDSAAYPIFKRRMTDFMVDNERGETVYARVTGEGVASTDEKKLGETLKNGHLSTQLEIPYTPPKDADKRKLQVQIRHEDSGYSDRTIEVPIVAAEGLTVVSDIDDTIKISNVVDKRELIANTFTREFRPAPGMANLYQKWSKQDAAFHYVSASPWNLQAELSRFADDSGFPSGVYHLREFRLKDFRKTYKFIKGSKKHKVASISTLLEQFPERRFILVGDTGEKDPEIYGQLARRFPEQVQSIYLRRVDGAENDQARFSTALEGVPAAKWTVFSDPQKL